MAFYLSEMTWPEVEEALKTVKLAVIPLGAHEQHGPHVTENCDAVLAEAMARRLVARLHPYAVMTPTIPFGISIHHIHFPGTITLRPETLTRVLHDVIWSLQQHGLHNFLILNSHGGNQSLLGVATTEISYELGVKVYYAKTTASAKQAIRKNVHSQVFGHSCEREVSEALFMAPEIVREDRLSPGDFRNGDWRDLRPGNPIQGFYFYDEMTRNGCIGDATQASFEAGQEIVEEALEGLVKAATKLFALSTEHTELAE